MICEEFDDHPPPCPTQARPPRSLYHSSHATALRSGFGYICLRFLATPPGPQSPACILTLGGLGSCLGVAMATLFCPPMDDLKTGVNDSPISRLMGQPLTRAQALPPTGPQTFLPGTRRCWRHSGNMGSSPRPTSKTVLEPCPGTCPPRPCALGRGWAREGQGASGSPPPPRGTPRRLSESAPPSVCPPREESWAVRAGGSPVPLVLRAKERGAAGCGFCVSVSVREA